LHCGFTFTPHVGCLFTLRYIFRYYPLHTVWFVGFATTDVHVCSLRYTALVTPPFTLRLVRLRWLRLVYGYTVCYIYDVVGSRFTVTHLTLYICVYRWLPFIPRGWTLHYGWFVRVRFSLVYHTHTRLLLPTPLRTHGSATHTVAIHTVTFAAVTFTHLHFHTDADTHAPTVTVTWLRVLHTFTFTRTTFSHHATVLTVLPWRVTHVWRCVGSAVGCVHTLPFPTQLPLHLVTFACLLHICRLVTTCAFCTRLKGYRVRVAPFLFTRLVPTIPLASLGLR